MDEGSFHFWIVPIVALVAGGLLGAGAIEYKVNTVWPNAIIELDEIKSMSCPEIKDRNASGNYWTPSNGQFARDKIDACLDATAAIKKLEKERMDALLADPNSFESLVKKQKEITSKFLSYAQLYESHSSQADILKQNMTDFKQQIDKISEKLNNYYTKN